MGTSRRTAMKAIGGCLLLLSGCVVPAWGDQPVSHMAMLMANPDRAADEAGTATVAKDGRLPATVPALVEAIRSGLREALPRLAVPPVRAVSVLDNMLIGQYGATGHLMGEPSAQLKPMYIEAATLLINGYPIAGGTLVNAHRRDPDMLRSKCGPALGMFVDAMLSPTGEDDAELRAFQQKAEAIEAGISGISPDRRLAAQVMLLGEVYGDGIARDAGRKVFEQTAPTESDRKAVAAARKAAAAIPVPSATTEQD